MIKKDCFVLAAIMIAGIFLVGCGVPSEVQQQLTQLQTENSRLKTEESQWQTEKAALEKKVADLNAQEAGLTQKALKDPTYAEAAAFMKEDKTNSEVTQDHDLATILVAENARKQGINCSWVIARLKAGGDFGPGGVGYNFVGFNTTDKGWIYFCNSYACADREIKLEVGKKWSDLNPGFGTPYTDDTIISIHHVP